MVGFFLTLCSLYHKSARNQIKSPIADNKIPKTDNFATTNPQPAKPKKNESEAYINTGAHF